MFNWQLMFLLNCIDVVTRHCRDFYFRFLLLRDLRLLASVSPQRIFGLEASAAPALQDLTGDGLSYQKKKEQQNYAS